MSENVKATKWRSKVLDQQNWKKKKGKNLFVIWGHDSERAGKSERDGAS